MTVVRMHFWTRTGAAMSDLGRVLMVIMRCLYSAYRVDAHMILVWARVAAHGSIASPAHMP